MFCSLVSLSCLYTFPMILITYWHSTGKFHSASTNFLRPCVRQLHKMVWKSSGVLVDEASHICMGGSFSTSLFSSIAARFSPAWLRPVRKITIFRSPVMERIPVVNIPVRSFLPLVSFSLSSSRIFIVVSSLWIRFP